MKFLFQNLFFEPLYNALVWLSAFLPNHSIGLAIVILTLVVKLLLFPLQHHMSRTQAKLRTLESEFKNLKAKYADNKTEQTKQVLALYRLHGVNPFISIVLLLIQLPIFFALFYVFKDSFTFHPEWLYSFVVPPAVLNTKLFGLIEMTEKSVWLAVASGLTQFIQIRLASPPQAAAKENQQGRSLKEELVRSMNVQARYIFPVMIVFVALGFPSALALYWVVSNLFTIIHELVVRRRAKSLLLGSEATS